MALHEEAGSAVTPPPPPPPVPVELFLLPPQPAATSASTPTAARSAPSKIRFFTCPPPLPDIERKYRRYGLNFATFKSFPHRASLPPTRSGGTGRRAGGHG